VTFVALSLAVITLDYREGPDGPLAGIGESAQMAMAPLQRGVTAATRPVGDFFSGLAHLPSLSRENQDLKNQVADYQTQIADYAEQQKQLASLYDLLGLKQTLDPAGVPAVVIGNGVSNFEWSITIDKGSNDGVQLDQPVVTGSASSPRLVGRVVSVTPISSQVQLLIDRRSAVAGLLSSSREVGEVVGQGDQDLRMDLITPGTKIDLAGDPVQVFTVSYDIRGNPGLYPPGLLIGTVSRVYEGSNELQTSVSVRPAVDFSALEYVLVLQTNPKGTG
jgi:rod shape-determining protein MreC